MQGKGRWPLTAALLAFALLASPAAALKAEGSFAVEGEIRFPEAATVAGAPRVLHRGSQPEERLDLGDFHIRAAKLTVRHFVAQAAYADAPGLLVFPYRGDARESSYVLHDATITLLAEEGPGYVGIDGRPGATLAFSSTGTTTMDARNHTVIASAVMPNPTPDAGHPGFYRVVDEEHLYLEAPGRARVEGPGAVKLFGLALQVDAAENSTHLATGQDGGGSRPAGLMEIHWVVLESDDLRIDLSSQGAWEVVATGAQVDWNGEAVFRSIQGELRTREGAYRAEARPTTLEGAFSGALRTEGEGRAVRMRLDVSGDLDGTTMAVASAPASLRDPRDVPGLPWLVLGAVVSGSAIAAGAFWVSRRRPAAPPPPRPPEPTAEECVARADLDIHQGDLTSALHWITRARRLAPTAASVCATQAFVLGELGRVDDALAAYREASRLAPAEGEYALTAARLAFAAGRPPELVEDLIEWALARDPALVEELERDGFFADLSARPRFEHVVERAWRRFVGDLSGPDEGT